MNTKIDIFGDKLKEAGLSNLPFSWNENGEFTFSDAITESQKKLIIATWKKMESDL